MIIIPQIIFTIDYICKVKTYIKKVETFTWLQLFSIGEIGFLNQAWWHINAHGRI